MSEVIRIADAAAEAEDRFARFRLIGWWDQERLAQARVVVIGAGALGNEAVLGAISRGPPPSSIRSTATAPTCWT